LVVIGQVEDVVVEAVEVRSGGQEK
jgi:hypothetical protein